MKGKKKQERTEEEKGRRKKEKEQKTVESRREKQWPERETDEGKEEKSGRANRWGGEKTQGLMSLHREVDASQQLPLGFIEKYCKNARLKKISCFYAYGQVSKKKNHIAFSYEENFKIYVLTFI